MFFFQSQPHSGTARLYHIEAVEGEMEYIYTYDKDIDPENGLKMKFEIYGLRHTASGGEQKSATSSKVIILK